MQSTKNIFLIGPMGVGKSTIGKQLAEKLGMTFEDSDWEIQRRTGVDIPTIFEYEGEAGFRKREKVVIDELTGHTGMVLATGGGAVLDSDNRRCLASRGLVIYLFCSPEQQFARTQKDKNRPLLQTNDPQEKLRMLMDQRDPLYRQVADFVVSTEGRNTTAVTKEIIKLFNKV